MILIIVLVLMVIVYYVKYTGNQELIKEHCKTPNDKANIINAKKVYKGTRTSNVLLILSFVSLIAVIIIKFTSLDYLIHDYFSSDIVEEKDFSNLIFLIPGYIFVSRLIINEVKIGDFLYKFFQVKEPELEENIIKSILFKKPAQKAPATDENTPEQTKSEENKEESKELPKEEPIKEEKPKEETPKEEIKEEVKPEEKPNVETETPKEEAKVEPTPEIKEETSNTPEEIELPKENAENHPAEQKVEITEEKK